MCINYDRKGETNRTPTRFVRDVEHSIAAQLLQVCGTPVCVSSEKLLKTETREKSMLRALCSTKRESAYRIQRLPFIGPRYVFRREQEVKIANEKRWKFVYYKRMCILLF